MMVIALLSFTVAMANAAEYNCSYKNIVSVASYNDAGDFRFRDLSRAETKWLENYVDDAENCNEGVEFRSIVKKGTSVYLQALCWADSMGSKLVELEMRCVEEVNR